MSDIFLLTDAKMTCLMPHFPVSHGKRRADDKRVFSKLIFFVRNGLGCYDAPTACGPCKTPDGCWSYWSGEGIHGRMMAGLAAKYGEKTTVLTDTTYLKPHPNSVQYSCQNGGRRHLLGRCSRIKKQSADCFP